MSDAVLLPVYNEGPTVGSVLDAVRAFYFGEVIVVDDGSTDETTRVLAERDDISVVHLDRNCGYGCALRVGFRVASDLGVTQLITMDCDGQHEPSHIVQFCEALSSCGTDIVSGSRYLPGSGATGTVPGDRQEVNRRVTEVVNAVTGWELTDTFCGFKAYRADALRRMGERLQAAILADFHHEAEASRYIELLGESGGHATHTAAAQSLPALLGTAAYIACLALLVVYGSRLQFAGLEPLLFALEGVPGLRRLIGKSWTARFRRYLCPGFRP